MARISRTADCWLTSLGVTLLVLSVVLVPTSALLGDTGGGAGLAACLNQDGCNSGGCVPQGVGCQDQIHWSSVCSWSFPGCDGCGCRGCEMYPGAPWFCNCMCREGLGTCQDANTCNYQQSGPSP